MDVVSLLRLMAVTALLCTSGMTEAYWINDFEHPCVRDCDASPEPMTCNYDWTIEAYYSMSRACYKCPTTSYDCYRPHCIPLSGYTKQVLAVNRKIPGPSIQVCRNDIINVRVRNAMKNEEGAAIHWHGLHQRQFPYMDGVSAITQCPIVLGHDFTYSFLAEPSGTHWWHAHSGLQRAEGVYGSLIIRDSAKGDPNSDMYDVDDPHHVIIVTEWAKASATDIVLSATHAVGVPASDGLLINGRGTDQEFPGEDNTTVTVDPPVFYVTSGLRHRFRLIGAMSGVCSISVSVDDHKLTVIAMDGAPVVPFGVDVITIFSGERYDFVVDADQNVDNYWVRAAGELGCGNFQELAIVHYKGAPHDYPKADPDVRRTGTILNPSLEDRSESHIFISDATDAEEQEDTLDQVDVTHYTELDAVTRNLYTIHHPIFYPYQKAGPDTYDAFNLVVINNITFKHPGLPLLTHAQFIDEDKFCDKESMKSKTDCSVHACECIHRIEIEYDQVVELVIINKGNLPHPFHLHGYYLDVLASELMPSTFTTEDFKRLDEEGKIIRNLKNPPRKDTIRIPGPGYVVTRFRADNPGWWFFHCHFDNHQVLGMAAVFYVKGPLPSPPPPNMPVCVNENLLQQDDTRPDHE